jgi:hypothetical protein
MYDNHLLDLLFFNGMLTNVKHSDNFFLIWQRIISNQIQGEHNSEKQRQGPVRHKGGSTSLRSVRMDRCETDFFVRFFSVDDQG